MDETGLDMLLDIHGDEELPYNFINGNEVSHDCIRTHACCIYTLPCQTFYASRSRSTGELCSIVLSCVAACFAYQHQLAGSNDIYAHYSCGPEWMRTLLHTVVVGLGTGSLHIILLIYSIDHM